MDIIDWAWADDDTILYGKPMSYLSLLTRSFGKPKSRIRKLPSLLNQDEFYKQITGQERGSPYCTAYAAFHTFSNFYWQHPSEELRLEFVEYCLANDIIHDTETRSGGSTVKTARARAEFLNAKWLKCDYYLLEMGKGICWYIQNQWHAIATSFIINDGFVKDRADDNKINGLVHSWKKYNGHAVVEVGNRGNVIVGNNYWIWLRNFVIPREYTDEWYDNDYHRRYGALIVYS